MFLFIKEKKIILFQGYVDDLRFRGVLCPLPSIKISMFHIFQYEKQDFYIVKKVYFYTKTNQIAKGSSWEIVL